ncbi:hypothetical protein JCM10207_004522 [Rhodosporidiobolus poonsookiae]
MRLTALAFAAYLLFHPLLSAAVPLFKRAAPTVTTTYGTWTGNAGTVESWKGIPFASPPTGDLRFASPVKDTVNHGTYDATSFGKSCPQMNFANGVLPGFWNDIAQDVLDLITSLPFFSAIAGTDAAEDCLTLNIWRLSGTTEGDDLPVMVYIFGGAFLIGSTTMYDATSLVSRSIKINQPTVLVSMNYRLNSFGFLPGAEAAADPTVAPNAGLEDQRLALEWVQENIGKFGGDPNKVTIFGESAGGISAAFQMLAYDGDITSSTTGNPLFRAAILQSGSPIPVGPPSYGQDSFDTLASAGGCGSASDKIACLRALSYDAMVDATNRLPNILSYNSVSLPFLPRTDGTFLTAASQELTAGGKYAKVPVINGDMADEGTILALGTLNITTEAQLKDWLQEIWFPRATSEQIDGLLDLYPADITQGSPYDTGLLYAVTPQFKRINAIIGDLVFQAERRSFVEYTQATQPTWSYLSRAFRATPFVGSFHGADLLAVFGIDQFAPSEEMQTRWIAFANNLDPNVAGWPYWPQYGTNATLLQFTDLTSSLITDNYRTEQLKYIWSNAEAFAQ